MLQIPLFLLLTHFVADFLFQTDWMALNKSKSYLALFTHCMVYSSTFFLVLCFAGLDFWGNVMFCYLTFLTHFGTDAITSTITSKLWFVDLKPLVWPDEEPGPKNAYLVSFKPTRHWFFATIGFDQLIHFFTLALTWRFIQ